MLEKSICDCNAATRQLLKESGILDYASLSAGEAFATEAQMGKEVLRVNCYRSKGRGDNRIWISGIRNKLKVGDLITFKVADKKLRISIKNDELN